MRRYPKLNEKLLKCVLKFLKDNPENYNQNVWLTPRQMRNEELCNSTGCVAGWTCMLTLPKDVKWKEWAVRGGEMGICAPNFWDIAREKLGLTEQEGNFLFGRVGFSRDQQLPVIKQRVRKIRLARKKGLSSPYELSHD